MQLPPPPPLPLRSGPARPGPLGLRARPARRARRALHPARARLAAGLRLNPQQQCPAAAAAAAAAVVAAAVDAAVALPALAPAPAQSSLLRRPLQGGTRGVGRKWGGVCQLGHREASGEGARKGVPAHRSTVEAATTSQKSVFPAEHRPEPSKPALFVHLEGRAAAERRAGARPPPVLPARQTPAATAASPPAPPRAAPAAAPAAQRGPAGRQ